MGERGDPVQAHRAVVAHGQVLGEGNGGMGPLGLVHGVPGPVKLFFGGLQFGRAGALRGLLCGEFLFLLSQLGGQLAAFGVGTAELFHRALVGQRVADESRLRLEFLRVLKSLPPFGKQIVRLDDPLG